MAMNHPAQEAALRSPRVGRTATLSRACSASVLDIGPPPGGTCGPPSLEAGDSLNVHLPRGVARFLVLGIGSAALVLLRQLLGPDRALPVGDGVGRARGQAERERRRAHVGARLAFGL